MPDNIASIVMSALLIGLWAVAMICILIKTVKNKRAPVKVAAALVAGKNTVKTFSKYAGNAERKKYVVIFSVDGRKKSFYVSDFSYAGYRVGEKGTLKYKGDRLIEFK